VTDTGAKAKRKWVGGGFISGVLATVLGTIAVDMMNGDEHEIPRPVAEHYFDQYWSDIIEDKAVAWGHLSDEYKDKYNLTFENYGEGFRAAFQKIEVSSVRRTEHRNTFRVTLVFVKKSGGRSRPETIDYHVRCGWWKSRAPFTNCSSDELIIDDGTR
jgi:hypothetical protein